MRKLNKISLFILIFLFALFMHKFSIAKPAHDIPLCGGAIVPDIPRSVMEASSTKSSKPVVLKRASQDKVHVIDIAFIYPGSITNRGKLLQNIEAAVLRANVIFKKSNVNARLRTVAVQPDHKYNISLDGVELHIALNSERGMLSILKRVRKDYGADLVYALTNEEQPRACGRALVRRKNDDKTLAANYASVGGIWIGRNYDDCLGNNALLAHEVGHNLGLAHNIEDTSSKDGFISYGRGYSEKNVNNRYYNTVMGIEGIFDFSRFSTNATHDGLPMGSNEANASKALLYTIEDASNYAPTKVKDPRPRYTCTENS